ncbi:hypothetical protein F4680DRAFT_374006 [Xylaria scruposa]|nr:hypothetical protein F4680DRAFT_374006 [Xylaria scruposa]
MLRRPPTTLTLTAEDIAAYEDRRYAQQAAELQAQIAQAQSHAQLQPRSQTTRGHLRHQVLQQSSAMDTSTSSLNESIDEAMEDAAAGLDDDDDENEEEESEEEEEEEEEDDDDDDPFTAQRHIRSAAAAGTDRAVSPGAQRGAYIRQMRARGGGHARSHSHATHAHGATSIPTATSAYTSAAGSRAQRIAGPTSTSALPPATTTSGQVLAHLQQTPVQNTAQGGATTTRAAAGRGGGRQTSEPPPAPTRVTRSRDERLGIAPGQRPIDGPGGAAGPTTRRR